MLTIIPIPSIKVLDGRQREIFGDQELSELRESILSPSGLMQPILVRPGKKENEYILVAGERRLRAITSIETTYSFGSDRVEPGNIPALVKQFDSDIDAHEAELHENIVRVNLSWQEKAKAISALHEMKLLKNPQQKISQTAYLIDQSETAEKTGYASSTAIARTQNSILVAEFLHDPEVAKAASLKDATKVVTRKLEQENLLRLREYAVKKQQEEAARKLLHTDGEGIEATENNASSPSAEEDILTDYLDALGTLSITTAPASVTHLLYEGDMQERILDVPDGSINVVVTDPPYGSGVANFGDSGASALPHEYSEENFEDLHRVLVGNLSRICGSSAHAYIFCDIDYFLTLRGMVEELDGWRVRRTPLIWNKGSVGNLADGSSQGYKRSHELILYATRGKRPCSAVIPDVLTFAPVKNKIHAAQKPVALYEKLLEMSSVPGDTIFDAFAGSGTLFKAARKFAVKAIGIEMKPLFCEMCKLVIEGKENAEPEL